MERQIAMQAMMMQKQKAAQLGMARDRFYWYSAFVATVGILGSLA